MTVYGRIDDGLYEARTIEADSVYVDEHATFFYANDVDEEGDYFVYPHFAHLAVVDVDLEDGTWLSLSGHVQGVDGREFVLDTGFNEVRVDTDEMAYNPLDDEGYQKIDAGDRITVSGWIDEDFFEADELKAYTIVTLQRDATKTRDGAATN